MGEYVFTSGTPRTPAEWAAMLRDTPHFDTRPWWGEVIFMNQFWDIFCVHWVTISHALIIGKEL